MYVCATCFIIYIYNYEHTLPKKILIFHINQSNTYRKFPDFITLVDNTINFSHLLFYDICNLQLGMYIYIISKFFFKLTKN